MPKVEKERVTAYLYPWTAKALAEVSDEWGCSLGDAVKALIRWGHYALSVEAIRQGRSDIALDKLGEALSVGMQNWGPLTPRLPLQDAVRRDALALMEHDAEISVKDGKEGSP